MHVQEATRRTVLIVEHNLVVTPDVRARQSREATLAYAAVAARILAEVRQSSPAPEPAVASLEPVAADGAARGRCS
jgi:hypothetical protein